VDSTSKGRGGQEAIRISQRSKTGKAKDKKVKKLQKSNVKKLKNRTAQQE
jgi:hypothetical protein